MSVQIVFLDEALDDFRHIGRSNIPSILAKLELLETNPETGPPLGNVLTGYRKLVIGKNTWRIVYRVQDGTVVICEVWAVGARRDSAVYAEATKRVEGIVNPKFLPLKDVITRLGKALGDSVLEDPQSDLVPDWLAERLVETAKIPRERVVAMTGTEAFEAWNDFCSGARGD